MHGASYCLTLSYSIELCRMELNLYIDMPKCDNQLDLYTTNQRAPTQQKSSIVSLNYIYIYICPWEEIPCIKYPAYSNQNVCLVKI